MRDNGRQGGRAGRRSSRQEHPTAQPPPNDGRGRRGDEGPILIVDRDAATCARAARALRRTGLAVRVVDQVPTLLQSVKHEPPPALLLGSLPGPRTSRNVLEDILANTHDLPICLLLGPRDRPPAVATSAPLPYLRKPFELRQLVCLLQTMLEQRQLHRDFRQAVGEIAEQSREREVLLRIMAAIGSTYPLPKMLAELSAHVAQELQVTVCQVLLLDDERRHLAVETVFPVRMVAHPLRPGMRLPVADFDCYQRALAGQVVLLRREASGTALPPADRDIVLGPFRSGLLIPMATTQGIIGLLALLEERSWERSPFTARKIHLCQALSSQAAIAVQNGLLFAERERGHVAALAALVAALDAREREARAHSWRVQAYAMRLAASLGLPVVQRNVLAIGALLHDIGKIGIPDHILMKSGPLSPAEWVDMRKHPAIGAEILRDLDHLRHAREIVLTHHERFDGRGYHAGLAGPNIPLGARIFAVADALDAITSDRPYRRKATFVRARDEIARHAGTQFDPAVIAAFLAVPLKEWERIRTEVDAMPPAGTGSPLVSPLALSAALQRDPGRVTRTPDQLPPAPFSPSS